MLILMPIPHCFGYSSSVIASEIAKCESSPFVLLHYFCVAIRGQLPFHTEDQISISAIKAC